MLWTAPPPAHECHGWRYDIFYNQVKIGLLEICAGLWMRSTQDISPETILVDVEITIDRIPPTVLPYSAVYGFLQTVASLVTNSKKPKYDHLPNGETEYESALSDIRAAITALMWEAHQDDDWFPKLEVRLSGNPEHYYHLLQLKLEKGGSVSERIASPSFPT